MYWNIIAILEARSITPVESDFLLVDNSDGQGPFIEFWAEVRLGPQPSQADLGAVQAEADALQVEALKEPADELDAALAEVQAGLANVSTVADVVTALNDMLDAMRGQGGRAGRIAGRPV